MTDAPGASDVTVNTRYAMKRYRTGYNTGHAEGYQAGYLEGIKVNSAQTAELNARVADTTVQLSNQYQRIERFVELVDQLERKLAEATEANTSCTLYIASQMERIAELEAQLGQTWQPVWGIEINGIEVDAGGNSIGMTAIDAHGCKWYAESDLPANIRLCRRQEADDDSNTR